MILRNKFNQRGERSVCQKLENIVKEIEEHINGKISQMNGLGEFVIAKINRLHKTCIDSMHFLSKL
jgi:sensor domain CHASE-containing protein